MKLIIAYISRDRITEVTNSLVDHHVHGLTVSEARGFGQEHDTSHPEHHEYVGTEMTKKLRLEIACHDQEVERIFQALYAAAHTGQRGDGKAFVIDLVDALRLKTGERGREALGPDVTPCKTCGK